ncbi:MAG: glycosyltransferase, partial [Thermoplasmata archaeon]
GEYRVLVIIPCRGIDYTLLKNLRSISSQDYKADYVAVVDDEYDRSIPYIKEAGIRYIISSYPCSKCSGKVKAISTAIDLYRNYEIYVIADSDMSPERTWLRLLISPLQDQNVGISTTFPYFLPAGGFWSKFKAVWGTVGQSLMESDVTRFGWGGSLAFRKSLISQDMPFFSERISDDTALTKICKKKDLRIAYVREARPMVESPENFREFYEWANRQTALSIAASKNVFYYGIIFYSLYIFLFISAFVLSFYDPVFVVLFAPTVIGIIKMYQRTVIKKPSFALIYIIMPFFYMANLLKARTMKSITWRGRNYCLLNEE